MERIAPNAIVRATNSSDDETENEVMQQSTLRRGTELLDVSSNNVLELDVEEIEVRTSEESIIIEVIEALPRMKKTTLTNVAANVLKKGRQKKHHTGSIPLRKSGLLTI